MVMGMRKRETKVLHRCIRDRGHSMKVQLEGKGSMDNMGESGMEDHRTIMLSRDGKSAGCDSK